MVVLILEAREPASVFGQVFSGVILLCAARMLTYYNGQRRASGAGGVVAVSLVSYEYITRAAARERWRDRPRERAAAGER